MNEERLLKLADVVEQGTGKFGALITAFNMANWYREQSDGLTADTFTAYFVPIREDLPNRHECNSIACLAGFAVLSFGGTVDHASLGGRSLKLQARQLLDLTVEQSEELFEGTTNPKVTGAEAAACVRHFVETGKIEWWKFINGAADELDEEDRF